MLTDMHNILTSSGHIKPEIATPKAQLHMHMVSIISFDNLVS